jgi:hypothetical protein
VVADADSNLYIRRRRPVYLRRFDVPSRARLLMLIVIGFFLTTFIVGGGLALIRIEHADA